MHSGSMAAPDDGNTQACTCASPVPTLLEGKMAVVWEGKIVYRDPPCAETPKWAVQRSALSEKHVFELSWSSELFSSLRPAKWSLWRWSYLVLQGRKSVHLC